MELIELLDKIDHTAPKCCRTCKYMAIGLDRCQDCLGKAVTKQIEMEANGDSRSVFRTDYEYKNWEPGNWLRELHAAELRGQKNIVLGGQGEFDFVATNSPQSVAKHLHYVAGEVGGYVGYLENIGGGEYHLDAHIQSGQFKIIWNDNQLSRVMKYTDTDGDDYTTEIGWDRNDPACRW